MTRGAAASHPSITRVLGMRRFILTGTPGSGKTTIIRQLALAGFSVVEEAATDIHASALARGDAEPWRRPAFIDEIAELQRQRQLQMSRDTDDVQFHDRSVICTVALARYLGYPLSAAVSRELKRVETEAIFQQQVFFIGNLGFITPTAARRISFEEALRFEQMHERTYRDFGYELVPIEPANVSDRVAAINRVVRASAAVDRA